MVSVPKELNYGEVLANLPPATRNINMSVAPSNVSTAGENQQIIFDLPDSQNGYIVPSSLKVSFKANITTANANTTMRGVPAYTFFQRCDTFVQQGSQLIESINQYGVLCNVLYATKLTMSHKLGMAFQLGLLDTGATDPTNINLTGRVITHTPNDEFSCSAPLGTILSNCNKLVPAVCGFRIVLTTDQIANMFETANNVTAFSLSNMEIQYDMVEFNSPEIQGVVQELSDAGQITLKSQSYSLTSQSLQAGVQGSQTLTFNQRLSSIKSLVALFSGAGNNQVNGMYDSVNIAGNGSYIFEVGGNFFPQKPLHAGNCKANIYSSLADCWGGDSHDLYNESMSIIPVEFNVGEDGTTTATKSGRFYVGQNTEKLQTSALLTGMSSNNSAINLRLEISDATANAHQVSLICLYDSLLTIDLMSKQASVRV